MAEEHERRSLARRDDAPPALTPRNRRAAHAPQAVETLDGVIAELEERMRQLGDYIDRSVAQADNTADVVKLFALYGQSASRMGRLLRDRRALSDEAADSLSSLVGRLLDEVSTELGWHL
jgi:ABC-type transporter Mla subunit MlaD